MIEKLDYNTHGPVTYINKLNEVIDYLNNNNPVIIRSAEEDEELTREEYKRLFKEASGMSPINVGPYPRREDMENMYKPIEPKLEVGDKFYWINTFDSSYHWTVDECQLDDFLLQQYQQGDLNIFKTREQAEKALAEIKEVLRRYQ